MFLIMDTTWRKLDNLWHCLQSICKRKLQNGIEPISMSTFPALTSTFLTGSSALVQRCCNFNIRHFSLGLFLFSRMVKKSVLFGNFPFEKPNIFRKSEFDKCEHSLCVPPTSPRVDLGLCWFFIKFKCASRLQLLIGLYLA
jgi:hypothetical protein